MKLLRYIFYPFKLLYKLFKLLYKLPYYKMLSYAFFIALCFYAISALINYLFWDIQIGFAARNMQAKWMLSIISSFLDGDIHSLFKPAMGNMLTLSYPWITMNLLFSKGDWLIPNIVDYMVMLGMVYMITQMIRTIPISLFLKYIMFFWVVLIIFVSNNFEMLGVQFSMPLYAYFFGILDFYILAKLIRVQDRIWYKQLLLHVLLLLSLIITFFVWTIGFIVWFIVSFLFFLLKKYKISLLYFILYILIIIFYFYIINVSFHNFAKLKGNNAELENLFKFTISMFGTPASNTNYVTPLSLIFLYFRSFLAIGITILVFFIARITRVLNIKKFIKQDITFQPWEIFLIGLFLWSLCNVIITIILRYEWVAGKDALYGLTSFFKRYYLNFYMLSIPLFIYFTLFLKKYKYKIWTIIFSGLILVYVGYILIAYNNRFLGTTYYNNISIEATIASAMKPPMFLQSFDEDNKNTILLKKIWDLSGNHIWQRQLMGLNIQNSAWFIQDKPCKTCLKQFEIKEYAHYMFNAPVMVDHVYNTLEFHAYGHFPYKFSRTLFVTNAKGIVVGLGLKRFDVEPILNLFTVWSYLNPENYLMRGYIYNKNLKNQVYTLYAISLGRRHITKLYTFHVPYNLKEKKYIH